MNLVIWNIQNGRTVAVIRLQRALVLPLFSGGYRPELSNLKIVMAQIVIHRRISFSQDRFSCEPNSVPPFRLLIRISCIGAYHLVCISVQLVVQLQVSIHFWISSGMLLPFRCSDTSCITHHDGSFLCYPCFLWIWSLSIWLAAFLSIYQRNFNDACMLFVTFLSCNIGAWTSEVFDPPFKLCDFRQTQ